MNFYGLQTIAVDAIDFGDRLRSIDENYANLLAENIVQTGRLRQPIEVRGKGKKTDTFLLIAGGHRLRAAQLMNRDTIDAFVYEADDDEARMAEIDENLVRHDLNPLDRAVFMFQRKEIYERLHPETKPMAGRLLFVPRGEAKSATGIGRKMSFKPRKLSAQPEIASRWESNLWVRRTNSKSCRKLSF